MAAIALTRGGISERVVAILITSWCSWLHKPVDQDQHADKGHEDDKVPPPAAVDIVKTADAYSDPRDDEPKPDETTKNRPAKQQTVDDVGQNRG